MPPPTQRPSTDDGPSDASLVIAIGRFDESALSTVYDRHGGPVFALSRRLLRRNDLAEDVTQEIFMRLWTHPQRFDPDRGTLRTFLLSDTHGRSIDLLRSETSRKAREEKEGRMRPEPPRDVEGEVVARDTSDKVQQALVHLDEGQRAAITLAYFDGYTYRQVAEVLGEPEGTVKSRIRSGMQRLRVILAEAEVAPS